MKLETRNRNARAIVKINIKKTQYFYANVAGNVCILCSIIEFLQKNRLMLQNGLWITLIEDIYISLRIIHII